jgi:hypothetical protein
MTWDELKIISTVLFYRGHEEDERVTAQQRFVTVL